MSGDLVVVRRRLILADDRPVELADSYYPARIAGETPLAVQAKIKGGAVRILVESGHAITETVETVTARLPDAEEAELLAIAPSTPLLIVARVGRSPEGVPVEYAFNRMVSGPSAPLVYRMRTGAT